MKKIMIFMIVIMIITSGCGIKQGGDTALEKGTMPTEKLVINDGKITSGWESWNRFFAETTGAQESKHSTLERVIDIDYYYSEDTQTGEGASHFEIELRFEDEKYVYKNLTEGVYKTYEYLIEASGTPRGTDKKVRGYFLVNDNTLTYEDIEWSMLSSQSTDAIDTVIIFTETIK